jgi:Bacterial Ig-like domain (group 3)/FG-GAP-like repeat/Transmembrane protein 131-like N-terminal
MQGLNFAPAVAYSSGGEYAHTVVAADVNGDGKLDLIVSNLCVSGTDCSGGTVSVLLGNGDGTFQPPVTYGTGGYEINGNPAAAVAVADVNGDGKLDVLVTNSCVSSSDCSSIGTVGVLLGNGDGTFQPAMTYNSGGNQPSSIAVADVNLDGKPDLLVANLCCGDDSPLGVLLGNGDGTFQPAVTYSAGGYETGSISAADLNGDGKSDLVVANQCVNGSCGQGNVGVLLGNGDGTFQSVVPYSAGSLPNTVTVADVNKDGKPDLLVGDQCGNCSGIVRVFLGNGDGTFEPGANYNSGGYAATSVTIADVNGDGKLDLIVSNLCVSSTDCSGGTVGVLLGNGDGTFQTAVTYGSGGSYPFSVAVADANGDGKPDLLAANECSDSSCTYGSVAVLINTSISPTATVLTSSQNPSSYGQAVTLTATVTSQGFKGPPTGTVSFFDGTRNIGNSQINSSGAATLTTSTLAVGTHSMTATYNGDANFAGSTSPILNQVVQGAIVVLSPTRLDFGKQTVGIASSPKNVTLMNTGNVVLNIMSIGIVGTNRGDFAQTNNCGTSIPANGSCTINVTFTPRATGTRNGAVSVEDNAPGSPQKVPLTGVGVLPAVTFSPTKLNFPTQVVFTTSASQPVTLTNTGSGTLLITNISVTAEFRQTNNCPASLDPQGSCTINIQFHPRDKGLQSGSINVADNAPGSPQKLPLAGTGTWVRLLPPELKFGSQPVGTKSLPRKIILMNKGDGAVNISAISITGVDASDFAETDNCGNQVPSGGSCFIKVTFKPLKKGKRTADVSVHDDGGGSPQKVGLTGTGT